MGRASNGGSAGRGVLVNPIAPCEVHWSLSEISRALGVSTTIINAWCDKGVFSTVVVLPGGKGERRIPDSAFREFLDGATRRFMPSEVAAARNAICDFQDRKRAEF